MASQTINAPPRREGVLVRKIVRPGRWPFAKRVKKDFAPIVNSDFQKACATIVADVSRMAWCKAEHAKKRGDFEDRVAIAVLQSVQGLSGMTPGWGFPSVRVMRTGAGFAIQIDAPAAYDVQPFEAHAEIAR